MRHYTIIDTTRDELKRMIALSALNNTPLTVTAREKLDELAARRQSPATYHFQLEIDTIHPRDGDMFLIASTVNGAFARLSFAGEHPTLTIIDSPEGDDDRP